MKQKNQTAIFAAGCFWHVEEVFAKTRGVQSATSGYTGGKTKNPTYENVCSGTTGHAEAVQVEFNPEEITYKKLLEIFWTIHDPTSYHKQGPDAGSQYRSAIFYHDEKQKKEAEQSMKAAQKKYNKAIVTEIVKASEFYPAEEYHQKYFEKHPMRAKLCRAF